MCLKEGVFIDLPRDEVEPLQRPDDAREARPGLCIGSKRIGLNRDADELRGVKREHADVFQKRLKHQRALGETAVDRAALVLRKICGRAFGGVKRDEMRAGA